MKIKLILLTCLLNLILASNANAALITYAFQGTGVTINGSPYALDPSAFVKGAFTFDTETAGVKEGNAYHYDQAIANGFYIDIGDIRFSADLFKVYVFNAFTDFRSFQIVATDTAFVDDLLTPSLRFGLDFSDVIDGDYSLPTSAADFANAGGKSAFIQNTDNLDVFRTDFTERTRPETPHDVPAPPVVGLFIMGLVLLMRHRRMQTQ